MPTPLRLLLIEDNESDAELVLRSLRAGDFDVTSALVDTLELLREALEREDWDIVVSDYMLPGMQAPDALRVVRERSPELPFIVLSGSIGEETAVAALKAGANDYLMKDRLQRLPSAVRREIADAAARRERRLLEEQLRQAQKMESIGRLAGGVAHDMNNVLTVILGSADLLLKEATDDNTRQEAAEIYAAANRAIALIQQLLAFSRRQVMKPRILDLNVLLANVRTMLQRLIGETVELRLNMLAEIGSVQADSGQLEQVLLNLVVNAADAMPNGGPLTIETSEAEVGMASVYLRRGLEAGRYVILRVSDLGHGMDERTMTHIFEPFYTTKGSGKGTGLGLSTVYGIVKQSGGDIFVESEVGRGSTFTIFLPRVDASPEPVEVSPQTDSTRGGNETVLVVEDEAMTRSIVLRALSRFGYTVLEAPGGAAALELIANYSGKIDLILTDVVMPEMSGPQMANRLLSVYPGAKVLFMSGYSEEAIAAHGSLEAGAAFIQKPFSVDALAGKVRELLDQK